MAPILIFAALKLVASGKKNVKRLITHHFDITEDITERHSTTQRAILFGR